MFDRAARIVAVADAAAMSDPELAARRDLGRASSRRTLGALVEVLVDRAELRDDLAPERATDALYALCGESTYLRLVGECGWSSAEYSEWLARSVRLALLN
jgi:hypothetical protein